MSVFLQRERPLVESLCDIIAMYALKSYFKVNVANGTRHRMWVRTAHNPSGTPEMVVIPNKDYVLQSNSLPDEEYFRHMHKRSKCLLECLPYFATVGDIKKAEYKYTRHWLKSLATTRKHNAGFRGKWVYEIVRGMNYAYYHDFECRERLADDIVLFDLSMLDMLGTRMIYRRVYTHIGQLNVIPTL